MKVGFHYVSSRSREREREQFVNVGNMVLSENDYNRTRLVQFFGEDRESDEERVGNECYGNVKTIFSKHLSTLP